MWENLGKMTTKTKADVKEQTPGSAEGLPAGQMSEQRQVRHQEKLA